MAKIGNYKIPFDENGNMLSYDYGVNEWRNNLVFTEVMTYERYSRGRSSATITFRDREGHRYEMFMKDFDDLIRTSGLYDKTAKHRKWTFVKRGQNYGLRASFDEVSE